jgi:hypothetical protein
MHTRGRPALAVCARRDPPHAQAVKVERPTGRTTLTAENGGYPESTSESGRKRNHGRGDVPLASAHVPEGGRAARTHPAPEACEGEAVVGSREHTDCEGERATAVRVAREGVRSRARAGWRADPLGRAGVTSTRAGARVPRETGERRKGGTLKPPRPMEGGATAYGAFGFARSISQ